MPSPGKVDPVPFPSAIFINREVEFGEIYLVDDRLITIPDADRTRSGRTYHDTRRVVIVQNNNLNYSEFPIVLVAPLSSKVEFKRRFDILLDAKEEKDVITTASIVRLTLCQPILRADLGDCLGSLSRGKSAEIMHALLEMFGHSSE